MQDSFKKKAALSNAKDAHKAAEADYKAKAKAYEDIANRYNKIGEFVPAEDNGTLESKGIIQYILDAERTVRTINKEAPAFGFAKEPSPRSARSQIYPTMTKAHQEAVAAYKTLTKTQAALVKAHEESGAADKCYNEIISKKQ